MDKTILRELLMETEAIQAAMEAVMKGTTEDHAKWGAFKNFAASYNIVARKYATIAHKEVQIFDTEKMPGPMDTVWPVQKSTFDTVYSLVLILRRKLEGQTLPDVSTGFDDMLHPLVREAAIRHYLDGDYRNAVLDSIVAVCDNLRARTGLDLDGDDLVNQAFSLNAPILILADITTDSGKNDQRGFMDIFKGFYRGVRNPKAHSLIHDLDKTKAAQYLVLASILMRRVIDAEKRDAGASD